MDSITINSILSVLGGLGLPLILILLSYIIRKDSKIISEASAKPRYSSIKSAREADAWNRGILPNQGGWEAKQPK